MTRGLYDIAVCNEAKDVRPDMRLQVLKNLMCTRWNTLGIFGPRPTQTAAERSMRTDS